MRPHCSTLLLLLGCLSAGGLSRDRLLPVLLAAAQQLQVTSSAGKRLLCDGLETSGMLLVDGVCPNEDRLLRLNDLVAGLNALRSAGKRCQYVRCAPRSVVEECRTVSRAFWAQSWTS